MTLETPLSFPIGTTPCSTIPRYQYVVLKEPLTRMPDLWDEINRMATEGWRLVTIQESVSPGSSLATAYAYMEWPHWGCNHPEFKEY